jgi:hypothetical protein
MIQGGASLLVGLVILLYRPVLHSFLTMAPSLVCNVRFAGMVKVAIFVRRNLRSVGIDRSRNCQWSIAYDSTVAHFDLVATAVYWSAHYWMMTSETKQGVDLLPFPLSTEHASKRP